MTSPRNPTTTITVASVFLLTTHPLTCSPSGHPAQRTGHPAGYFGPGCTFYALYLFAGTGVLDKVPDVDDAIVASVGALQAGVVRLYGVVVILGGWVRVVSSSSSLPLSSSIVMRPFSGLQRN